MALIDTINAKLQHPIFQTLTDLIKKFKSSKSFYGIFYLLALFTIQQAIAWKYGTIISSKINDMGSEWYYGFVAGILEHGSIELVVLGVGLIGVLSYVEVNKDKSNRENSSSQGTQMSENAGDKVSDSKQGDSIDIGGDNSGIATIGSHNKIEQTNNSTTINNHKGHKLTLFVVVAIVLMLPFLPKAEINNQIDLNITGNRDSNITVTNTIGTSDQALQMILVNHQKEIEFLKDQLKKNISPQEHLKLSMQLQEAEKILENKTKEIAKLKKTIETIQPDEKIAQRANEIFAKDGIEKAIDYLEGVEFEKHKKLADRYNRSTAKALKLKAEFLIVENRYDKAKQAYKQMIHYDRSYDSLFEYAFFLDKQNHFKEATIEYENLLDLELSQNYRAVTLNNLATLYYTQNEIQEALKAYEEALGIRRELAKANPKVYKSYVAETLNNLAVLYSNQNQNQEALKAYEEALSIYRELAKANPKVYKANVATTLNNLAILYSDQNQNQEALKAYEEALGIRRELAKVNPSVYELDYANTLLVGVAYLEQNKKDLEEAREILIQERYREVYFAQKLLRWIERIEKQ